MKKLLVLLVIFGLLFVSCADEKTINGVTYRPYGLLNEDTQKNPDIQYEISTAAVITGIVFSETIVVPVYNFGFNLWEPISAKTADPSNKGVVSKK